MLWKKKDKTVTPVSEEPVKLKTKCRELMFEHFEECLIDNDLSSLVVSGEPTKEQMQEAWDNISAEFADLVGSKADTNHNKLITLQYTYNIRRMMLQMLANEHSPELCEYLKEIHKPKVLLFDLDNLEQYAEDIEYCLADLRGLKHKIAVLEATIEADKRTSGKASNVRPKTTRADFTDAFLEMSKHYGCRYDKTTTDVEMYAVAYKKMKAEAERVKARIEASHLPKKGKG